MVTRSVHMSDEDAEALRQLQAVTGNSEEEILSRAAAQGLRDLRLEQGIKAFKEGLGSGEAAVIAGLPRAHFLQELIDRGVTILDGPSTLSTELEGLARCLGDERLAKAAKLLSSKR
jgi:predicted HTH domain antitoxin